MTQEEKDLLLKDLCARLPYGVKCWVSYNKYPTTLVNVNVDTNVTYVGDDFSIITVKLEKTGINKPSTIGDIKPYLRTMSSVTEEEKERLQSLHDIISNENYGDGYSPSAWDAITEWEDYCNSRHLDYRGLIPMGLALEAPEDMYKEK